MLAEWIFKLCEPELHLHTYQCNADGMLTASSGAQYVLNNPLSFVDPSGLEEVVCSTITDSNGDAMPTASGEG